MALDMRGYNLSDKPEKVEAYAVPVIVEDVRALAEKLGAKKFVLVGHDWGGVIAWAFAAAHPEMLEKLVIVNAPHPTVFAQRVGHQSGPAEGEFLLQPVHVGGGGIDAFGEQLPDLHEYVPGVGERRGPEGVPGELESRDHGRAELLPRFAICVRRRAARRPRWDRRSEGR